MHFSPDGRWIAYNSTDSGHAEVYVAAFPACTRRRQVSNAGGCQAHCTNEGKEIVYLGLDGKLMAADVRATESSLDRGTPRLLFATDIRASTGLDQYCVTRDCQRFLEMGPLLPRAELEKLTVLPNWTAELGLQSGQRDGD